MSEAATNRERRPATVGRKAIIRNNQPEKVVKPKWVPKVWKHKYDVIVSLHLLGFSHIEISKRPDISFTPQQIGNIINSPQGQAIIKFVQERQRAQILKIEEEKFKSTEERLRALQEKALKAIEDFFEDETIGEKAPIAKFDRSLKILQSQGVVKNPDQAQINNNTTINNNSQTNFITSPEDMERLNSGIEKAMKVRELHAGQFKQLPTPNKNAG